jgi:hypothetical protein
MNARAPLLGLLLFALPVGAAAAEPADPFAAETPMDEAALRAARGGLVVNGFIIDFAIRTTLIIDGIASSAGATSPVAFDIDPSINTLVISNTLDGIEISRVIALDVVIPNFNAALSSAVAAGVGADLAPSLYSLSGF